MELPEDETDRSIEEAYANLMVCFFRLRKSGQVQREYDEMGIILNMLNQDRQHIRENFKINI